MKYGKLADKVSEMNIYENMLMDLKKSVREADDTKKILETMKGVKQYGLMIGIPQDQIVKDIVSASMGEGKHRKVYPTLYHEEFPEYMRNKKKSKSKTKRCKCKK